MERLNIDGSKKCNYKKCDYKCAAEIPEVIDGLDTDTFDLYESIISLINCTALSKRSDFIDSLTITTAASQAPSSVPQVSE